MKKILITGVHGYIGDSLTRWLLTAKQGEYTVDRLSVRDNEWTKKDFSRYDVIIHAAGIAHADVGYVSQEKIDLYYKVNTDLTINIARKCKDQGVKQFIFLSSMIVYSGYNNIIIHSNTPCKTFNFYGDSKLKAEERLKLLNSEKFSVCIVRVPMVYGYGAKGNYRKLQSIAKKIPVFPKYNNSRSMIYIKNLCEFIRLLIENEENGIFFPQNKEYVNTSTLVKLIGESSGHKVGLISGFNWFINLIKSRYSPIKTLANKVFGTFAYNLNLSAYRQEYRLYTLEESIKDIARNNE